jgi:hypothetical protein
MLQEEPTMLGCRSGCQHRRLEVFEFHDRETIGKAERCLDDPCGALSIPAMCFSENHRLVEANARRLVGVGESNAHFAAGLAGLGVTQTLAFRARPSVDRGELVVTHAEIVDAVWGKIAMSEGLLRNHVHDLRSVIGEGLVETVVGRGYRFTAEIQHVHTDQHEQRGRRGRANVTLGPRSGGVRRHA